MPVNCKGLILGLITQGPLAASEQTFEQSHTPLTIISAMLNSVHFVHHTKTTPRALFLNGFTADSTSRIPVLCVLLPWLIEISVAGMLLNCA